MGAGAEKMMNWLVSQLIPLTLLLAAVLLLRPLTLRWLGARWQYSLWAAVPLLLLLSQLPLLSVFTVDGERYRMQVSATKLSMALVKDPVFASGWGFACTIIWSLGVVVMIVLLLGQHWQLTQQLASAKPLQLSCAKLSNDHPDGSAIADAIHAHIACKQSATQQGPFVSGWLRPTVLLPHDFQQRFSPLQQQLVLAHEQTHWQRGDLHCNLLAFLLLTLFWFHPLSWVAYRAYRQDQELACDALVLQNASAEQKIAYSYALLSNAQQSAANWQLLTNHYGDKQMMKQRLIQLKQQQGFSKVAMAVTLIALFGAAVWLQQPVQAANDKIEPIKRIEPIYPSVPAQNQMEGYVVAEFDITPDGSVENINVIKSVPVLMFDKEAVDALKQWKYTSSTAGKKKAIVQLDFMLDPVPQDIERVGVTPSK
jgi:TonB family protein